MVEGEWEWESSSLTRAQTNCDLHVAILHKLQKQATDEANCVCGMPRTLPTCRKRATFLSISLICQLLGCSGWWGSAAVGVAKRREVAPPYQPAMAAAVDSSFLYSPCGCFVSPPSLSLSSSPSPFWLFVSRKSLKLILIFDLCQTNLGARHQTAPNRANYINFHIVSCFDTHTARSKKNQRNKKENQIARNLFARRTKLENRLF